MPKEKTFEPTNPDFEAELSEALNTEIGHTQKVRADARADRAARSLTGSKRVARDVFGNSEADYEAAEGHSVTYKPIPPAMLTPRKRVARAEKIAKILDTREYTGGSSSYYEIDILHPNKKRRPYMAECLDIIEALGMSFAEGECFKAIWRRCAARQGKSKRGYNDAKYDAEKIAFYGQRILDDVITPKGNKS